MRKRVAVLSVLLVMLAADALAEMQHSLKLVEGVMNWISDKQKELKIYEAASKIMNGGDAQDLDTIVEDYYLILKDIHQGEKPRKVELSEEDFSLVIVDGKVYDLFMIPHDDGDNTNRRMEIEVLLNDETPTALIEEKLGEMIAKNW